jgi:hypothetical protein
VLDPIETYVDPIPDDALLIGRLLTTGSRLERVGATGARRITTPSDAVGHRGEQIGLLHVAEDPNGFTGIGVELHVSLISRRTGGTRWYE